MSKKRTKTHRANKRWVIAGVVAVVILASVLIVTSVTFATSATPKASTTNALSAMSECGSSVCGQVNAPVTIEIYSDFQCPYCARADAVLQQLVPNYIDTGKAKVSYRNFVFIGTESEWAAQAAQCAAEQSKFWTFADYLFTHQAGENTGAFSRDNLKKIAAQIGLNVGAFNTCFDSGKYAAQVNQETSEGQQRGVQATPTFFINGQRYEGILDFNQLASLIDARLPK
jgi:protein-disulfide isomerase